MSARWSARPGALVDREARAGDLRAAGVVDDVERLGELPVRRRLQLPAVPLGADVALDGLLARQLLAPGPDRHVRVLAADRNIGVGGVRDPEEQVLELGLDGRSSRSIVRDPRAARVDAPGARRPLGRPASRRPGSPRRSASRPALRSALRLSASAWSAAPLARRAASASSTSRGVLALVDRAAPDDVRLLAQPLDPDAHAQLPRRSGWLRAAAAETLDATNVGSRLASSQPARGPFGRPRNAR